MKIVCSVKELVGSLGKVMGGVASKSTLPVLNNVLFETTASKIKVTATDLDMAVKVVINKGETLEIVEEGAITIPAKKLMEIVKALPSDENVTIDVDEKSSIKMKCKKTVYKIMGLPITDFPQTISSKKNTCTFNIKQEVLASMIKKTSFAVSADTTRVVLSGALLQVKAKEIIMVGTDGHRLALDKRAIAESKGDDVDIIVPVKILNEVAKVISGDNGIEVSISENQIEFAFDNVVMTSRLIDGKYPDYVPIINKQLDKKLTLDTKAFKAAVSRVSILAADATSAVKLTASDGVLGLNASTIDVGEAKDEVVADYKGEETSVAFNAKFILELLNAAGSEKVELNIKDSASAGIFKMPGDESYLYIVMPVRI